MADIILTTLNARYIHSAFGLRYLLANMGDLKSQTELLEFGINQHTVEILDAILAHNPRIVGLGVYIWNIDVATRLVGELKKLRPEITVILGGPEVSYETLGQPIVDLADYTITGEADIAFARICREILAGNSPVEKVIPAALPDFSDLKLPYDLYADDDIAHRVLYVEASRGCPFTCEFCLSALEIPVRQAPLDPFLSAMQTLFDRGARQFKFVDRTFNLNLRVGSAILEFFLERCEPGLFLHFEMIPDRLPEPLRALIARFPPGALQFEVGIQTFNEEVSERISRKQNNTSVEDNLRFLREETGVHVHADLIVGLPGESIESFSDGFDRLVAMRPQEIQVGMLKRLRGTPIVRHDEEWDMRYSPSPPYEILQNRLIDFADISRMRRFARYWDLVANSGNFVKSLPLIWGNGSPFHGFMRFAEWLFEHEGRSHGIPLTRLVERVFQFATTIAHAEEQTAAELVYSDYRRGGRRDIPRFLRRFNLDVTREPTTPSAAPARQSRHMVEGGGLRVESRESRVESGG